MKTTCQLLFSVLFLSSLPAPSQQRLGPPPVDEVGVYYHKADQWTEMMPEVINWKTGGVMKSLGSAGVLKGDVNGKINGHESRTRLTRPIELLIYCPEGTAISEYQLIKLHSHSDSRESCSWRVRTVIHVVRGIAEENCRTDGTTFRS